MAAKQDLHAPDPASKPDTMSEYEARRCHVCQAPHPPFGFGPPLTRPGRELWACRTHLAAVDGMLSEPPRAAVPARRQPGLL